VIDMFLNHSALFVAGELSLGLSLLVFIGALIVALGRAGPSTAATLTARAQSKKTDSDKKRAA
jgi:hypothetical protein